MAKYLTKGWILVKRSGLTVMYPHLYKIWTNIIQRIYNLNNPDYPNYGGRGLTLEFESFEEFVLYIITETNYLEHVKEHGEEDTTIERPDNDKGYTRGNIKFATMLEQADNRRNVVCFLYFSPSGEAGADHNVAAFARQHQLVAASIHGCIKGERYKYEGWYFEKITPEQLKKWHKRKEWFFSYTDEFLKKLARDNNMYLPSDEKEQIINTIITTHTMRWKNKS